MHIHTIFGVVASLAAALAAQHDSEDLLRDDRALGHGRQLSVNDGKVWYLKSSRELKSLAVQRPDGLWACRPGGSSGAGTDGSGGDFHLQDPIVVVGTDGSGTRAIAKFLALMNITLLVEQSVRGQLDVDGSRAGVHFTGAIQRLLATTRTPNYELAALPPPLERSIKANLMDLFASNLRSNACSAHPPSHVPQRPERSSVWAFKKPDLMNLLPFILAAFPRAQILHVVRDGRDMAFSHNHAPLKKYATSLVSSAPANPAPSVQTSPSLISEAQSATLRAVEFQALDEAEKQISLWNLQNLAVAEWGRANPASYQWIRIEDLSLSGPQSTGSTARRFANLFNALSGSNTGLTNHGGSSSGTGSVSPRALELRVVKVLLDLESTQLGSHDTAVRASTSHLPTEATSGGGEADGAVKSRYGKWRKLATAKQKESLNRLGHAALERFGYMGSEFQEQNITASFPRRIQIRRR